MEGETPPPFILFLMGVSAFTLFPHLTHKMGASSSLPPKGTPLGCLLGNLDALGLRSAIRPKCLIFFCNTTWPRYKLDNGSQWPENGTFDFNTLRDLDNFCNHNGKWSKIPYIQAFFTLCFQPSLCQSYSTFHILLGHTKRPSPLEDKSSSFDLADHSPPPTSPPPYAPTLPLSPPASSSAGDLDSETPGPSAPSSFPGPPSPPFTRSRAHPAPLLPLWEVAGAEGII